MLTACLLSALAEPLAAPDLVTALPAIDIRGFSPGAAACERAAIGPSANVLAPLLEASRPDRSHPSFVPWALVGGAHVALIPEMAEAVRQLMGPAARMLFVAVNDSNAVAVACSWGHPSILYAPLQRVQAAGRGSGIDPRFFLASETKFVAAAMLAEAGLDALLLESDVFLLRDPRPLVWRLLARAANADVIAWGHLMKPEVNAGIFYTRGNANTARFFRQLATIVRENNVTHFAPQHFRSTGKVFEQDLFGYCTACFKCPPKSRDGRSTKRPSWACGNAYAGCDTCAEFGSHLYRLNVHIEGYKGVVSHAAFGPDSKMWLRDAGYTAVHTLSSRPAEPPEEKIATAKLLGAWPGAMGYYDSPTARYLTLGPGSEAVVRDSWNATHPWQAAQDTVLLLAAIARALDRVLVLPWFLYRAGRPFGASSEPPSAH